MTQETEREKFDFWFSNGGQYPKAVEYNAHGGYILASAMQAWEVWQARAALEAKQAEVHMPEPVGKVSKQGWASWNGVVREGEPLYTEHQLRTLLAQHGIKIAD